MSSLPFPARWSSAVHSIRLAGADARRFLHGQSSQAIALAPPGSCLATCLISPTARMRGLALVLVEAQELELVLLSGDAAAIHRSLDRVLFPIDQVELGAPQPARLVRFTGEPGGALDGGAGNWLQPAVDLGAGLGQPALLLRSGTAMATWLEALPELSDQQAELQRIRQGFPVVPNEANDSTNPFELGLARWVSLNKGCYVGQETLAKLATYDGVKQLLRHWRCRQPAAALPPGSTLTTAGGERAGLITSSIRCSVGSAEGSEGLALVRRSALDQATLLAAGGPELSLSTPPAFVAPPLGAGAQGAAQA
jgi:folate-binding protein YgfZ